MEADRLLDGLNDSQRRAVTSPVVPLCILAGAGSGKTRVLTRRIAYRAATDQHDPRRVLALTFTRKAAGELGSRLRALGLRDSVAAGTFHAIALAQLRARWADKGITPPELLDRKVGFVARLVPTTARRSGGDRAGRAARDVLPLDLVSEIEWAKARRVPPEQYARAATAAKRKPPLEPSQVAEVYERYETEKKRRRMVDFDDLLMLCLRDLAREPELAAAVRWRRRHLFVDEYQDVNPLQQALLEAWLGDSGDLCVVGDPNQAIYAWNGADASHLNEFAQRWPRSEVVALDQNYRSSPQILAVANAVLARSQRIGGRRRNGPSGRGSGADPGEEVGGLQANRPDGPVPDIRSFADDRAEARAIARAVRDAHRPGSPWSSQAILVRTNAQTAVIEEALRLVRIPVRTRGGSSLLDQPEVKAALRDLRRHQGDFAAVVADLASAGASAGELAFADGDQAGDDGEVRADSRQANLQALARLAQDYASIDSQPSAAGFLAWLAGSARNDQPDPSGDAVELATFHAAKGLEWPIVHLAGLEQGLVPIGHAQTAAELAEERRLFYVAVTRAEQELHLSWAENRTFGVRTAARERSPYLADVQVAIDALAEGDVPTDWRAFFAARAEREGQAELLPAGTKARRSRGGSSNGRAGGALSELGPEDRRLFEALKEWRATVAKAASVPAYVVFHDATLEAIASTRPRSGRDLLALPGLGPVKVGRYGDGVLEVVAAHDE